MARKPKAEAVAPAQDDAAPVKAADIDMEAVAAKIAAGAALTDDEAEAAAEAEAHAAAIARGEG